MGNIVWGIPLDARGEFAGTFMGLLHPYALLMGVTTVALFTMHGALYLHMKTEDALQARIRTWLNPLIITFIICYSLTTLATLLYVPRMTHILREQPMLFVVVVLSVLAIANLPREIHRGRDGAAFVSSCATMLLLMALFGLGMFPNMVYATPDPAHSLTIYNAASTPKTLGIMTLIAIIGVPFVLTYTIVIYSIFHGKVKLDKDSY
jgi:cytochrome d ubiquinol oxidase subunit II